MLESFPNQPLPLPKFMEKLSSMKLARCSSTSFGEYMYTFLWV